MLEHRLNGQLLKGALPPHETKVGEVTEHSASQMCKTDAITVETATCARERRNVWMINQYASTRQMPTSARHAELAELLASLNWDATIFASREGQVVKEGDSTRRGMDSSDEAYFVWVRSLPFRDNGFRRYLNMASFMLTATISQIRRPSPNVIIGSSPHLLAALSGLLVAKLKRTAFVVEICDLWPDSLIQLGFSNRPVIRILSLIETALYRYSDRIIVLTEGIERGIAEKGIDPSKLSLIPNASLKPAPLDSEEREHTRSLYGWTGKTVVIWPGVHNFANGLETIVDAARMMREQTDILFVFVGDGTEKQQLVKRAENAANIQFWDPVPKEEISRIVRAADIGVLHSRAFKAFEGARPNKLFEYMAGGIAILNALPGEASRLVAEAKAGIDVEWENACSIASGILELSRDPRRVRKLGRNGFEYVTEHHSREKTANDLAWLLDDVVEKRGGR